MNIEQLSMLGTMLYAGGGLLFALIGSYIIHLRMKDKQKLEDLHDKVQLLSAERVNEARVRDIVREELKPLSSEMHEVKGTLSTILNSVQSILITMAEERGMRRAISDSEKRNNNE